MSIFGSLAATAYAYAKAHMGGAGAAVVAAGIVLATDLQNNHGALTATDWYAALGAFLGSYGLVFGAVAVTTNTPKPAPQLPPPTTTGVITP